MWHQSTWEGKINVISSTVTSDAKITQNELKMNCPNGQKLKNHSEVFARRCGLTQCPEREFVNCVQHKIKFGGSDQERTMAKKKTNNNRAPPIVAIPNICHIQGKPPFEDTWKCSSCILRVLKLQYVRSLGLQLLTEHAPEKSCKARTRSVTRKFHNGTYKANKIGLLEVLLALQKRLTLFCQSVGREPHFRHGTADDNYCQDSQSSGAGVSKPFRLTDYS